VPATLTGTTHSSQVAALRDRWQLAADAIDAHTARCGCFDDPCDEALLIAEDEMLAWDRLESVADQSDAGTGPQVPSPTAS
jgi:hypothetical protein